jgi:excisionase family DNA binding protein
MQRLRRSRQTICAWARSGRLPAVRLPGGGYAFRPADIETWLVSRSTGDTTAIAADQAEALMSKWRKQYAAGILPQWKIDRIERIQGWKWAEDFSTGDAA